MQLGVREAARILGVSEKSVYRWIKQGSLPAYRVQDQYRIHRSELLEWVSQKKLPVSEEIFHEPDAAADHPTLALAIEAGGVFYRLDGTDKESVLREVANNMRLPDEANRDFVFQMLLAREKMCTTAIGDGVAIPHPRSPIVFHVHRPAVTLCFLEHPLDFGAFDGLPVRVLFTLVSPTVREHLQLLSRLSYALRDPDFKRVIQAQGTRQQILHQARLLDAALDAPGAAAPPEAGGND